MGEREGGARTSAAVAATSPAPDGCNHALSHHAATACTPSHPPDPTPLPLLVAPANYYNTHNTHTHTSLTHKRRGRGGMLVVVVMVEGAGGLRRRWEDGARRMRKAGRAQKGPMFHGRRCCCCCSGRLLVNLRIVARAATRQLAFLQRRLSAGRLLACGRRIPTRRRFGSFSSTLGRRPRHAAQLQKRADQSNTARSTRAPNRSTRSIARRRRAHYETIMYVVRQPLGPIKPAPTHTATRCAHPSICRQSLPPLPLPSSASSSPNRSYTHRHHRSPFAVPPPRSLSSLATPLFLPRQMLLDFTHAPLGHKTLGDENKWREQTGVVAVCK